MTIYLPTAEISANIFVLLGLGGIVGLISGIFGVGGGFLMTPLLLFIGVPVPAAVASEANQIVAASVSGMIAHWRRGNVDFRMGFILLTGGIVGSALGVQLFSLARGTGQIDLLVRSCYVVFLGSIGLLMLVESLRTRARATRGARRKLHQHSWAHGLPFKVRFRASKLYISIIPPLGIGLIVGVLAAVMGVGGGFIMVPAMIYLLGMPTNVVVGTSLFQIVFVMANVTILQSVTNHAVDVILALLLSIGGVIGVQIGVRLGARLRGEEIRALLALLVLTFAVIVAYDLVHMPEELYSVDKVWQ